MKRLFLCTCIFLSLVPVVLWGQNRAGLQSSKLETEVLYDIEGIVISKFGGKMERLLGVVILLKVGRKLRMPHGVWIRNGYQLWQIKFWIKYVLTILTAQTYGE